MIINMTGLERIREETCKNELLKQQEEELYNNTKAEYRKYQKSAYDSIKAYFDTLKTILDNSGLDYLSCDIDVKNIHMKYMYDKNSVEPQKLACYNQSITFKESYETEELYYPKKFEDLGIFSQVAADWNDIQASLEQTIITRISLQNDLKQDEINRYKENIENYKKLSNEEKVKDNKQKNLYEVDR